MIFIKTKRLILRNYIESDIEKFIKINQDKDVMEFFPKIYSAQETRDFTEKQNELMSVKKFGFFAAEIIETGEFIGFVGLNIPSFEVHFTPCVEIGWRIAAKYWNQGFASEASKASLEYGFKTLRLPKIIAFTAKTNKKSQRIMQKIGMNYDENDDFLHPLLPKNHELALHVLFKAEN